jgi:hypothetical protein
LKTRETPDDAKYDFSAIVTCGLSSHANAEMLTATETVTGSGTFDGSSFTDARVTLTTSFETSAVGHLHSFSGLFVPEITTVTVGGVSDTLTGQASVGALGTFPGQTELFTTGLGIFGFFAVNDTSPTSDFVVLSTLALGSNSSLDGPVGPVTATPGFSIGFQFLTAGGGFFESDSASTDATFTIGGAATPTPQPGSLTLAVVGAVSVALGAWRKRCRQEA